ncbi:MAG TPA: hypothetical protein PL182_14020, partial [Pseudobdellovibrionaceae bacterium]|nr:hypothetical protein [Pseudobdellovibrionaceae bacterium]
DQARYGTFAEIGAGQEVARHFFQVGRASQTIAKSMSAYDMTYSDEIYGREKNGRYVCESRLNRMLDKEANLLVRRLDEKRGADTCFFVFANTVATGSPESPRCHGWMGVRFQTKPRGPFNDIVLHVRMMDRHRLRQQEALGALGVNLVEAAFYGLKRPDGFLDLLVENLKSDQVVVDIIRFSGPDLKAFDDRTLNLELVKRGLAEAVLFSPKGDILSVSDTAYGKAVLVQRGAYRPPTSTHVDVIQKGLQQMASVVGKKTEILPMMEIVIPRNGKARDFADLEHRIDAIGACGYYALISNLDLYYRLKHFMRKYTQLPMTFIMGASKLEKLFDQKHYADLEGGVLEGLGKLLDSETKIAVYPHKTEKICLTAKMYRPSAPLDKIYDYFLQKGQIQDISGCDETSAYSHSDHVRRMIEKKEKGWEKLILSPVVDLIKKRKIWGA